MFSTGIDLIGSSNDYNPRPGQGYIFLQIPCFLGREKIQSKFKLGKKLRNNKNVCMKWGRNLTMR